VDRSTYVVIDLSPKMAEERRHPKDNENSEENLWASVLSEVQTSRSSQLPASKNLLVLGDKESGKTTLVAKLQGNEDPKKRSWFRIWLHRRAR